MLELNGKKYSKESFDGYTHRAQVRIHYMEKNDEGFAVEETSMDIYTDDGDKKSVENVLLDRRREKVTSLQIRYWTTKEQDDACAEMINEWLKEDG